VGSPLQGIAPHRLADWLAAEAGRRSGGEAGVYLIDLDGRQLVRVGGGAALPAHIGGVPGVGPELAPDVLAGLGTLVERAVPGAGAAPMLVGGRAIGAIVAPRAAMAALAELAGEAAQAIELATGRTDVFERARRIQPISPAAEIQQNVLPPRLSWPQGAELAATIQPTYEVGGDWFDHASNDDGVWIAVADGVGKGTLAAAVASVALGALRAARRNGDGLEEAAAIMHRSLFGITERSDFVTAVVARWEPATSILRWVNAGHPRPLVIRADGPVEEPPAPTQPPLGLLEPDRLFLAGESRLEPGDRLVLYSDGVTERRREDGSEIGEDGLRRVLEEIGDATAEATVRAIQEAVRDASAVPIRDDATVLVLRVPPAPERLIPGRAGSAGPLAST
jgi:serine phosphatase RsbU (regulator of sigma subunit)